MLTKFIKFATIISLVNNYSHSSLTAQGLKLDSMNEVVLNLNSF